MTADSYDVLLRFNSAALEERFWASAPVRSALLRADRVSVVVAVANNGMLVYSLFAMSASSVLPLQLGFFAILLFAQLAARRCVPHNALASTLTPRRQPAHPPPPAIVRGRWRSLQHRMPSPPEIVRGRWRCMQHRPPSPSYRPGRPSGRYIIVR